MKKTPKNCKYKKKKNVYIIFSILNISLFVPVPYILKQMLRSRSVFDRLQVFSPAPAPAPIRSRLLTILNYFINIPPPALVKNQLFFIICFLNEQREYRYHSEFLLYLCKVEPDLLTNSDQEVPPQTSSATLIF